MIAAQELHPQLSQGPTLFKGIVAGPTELSISFCDRSEGIHHDNQEWKVGTNTWRIILTPIHKPWKAHLEGQ